MQTNREPPLSRRRSVPPPPTASGAHRTNCLSLCRFGINPFLNSPKRCRPRPPTTPPFRAQLTSRGSARPRSPRVTKNPRVAHRHRPCSIRSIHGLEPAARARVGDGEGVSLSGLRHFPFHSGRSWAAMTTCFNLARRPLLSVPRQLRHIRRRTHPPLRNERGFIISLPRRCQDSLANYPATPPPADLLAFKGWH